MSTSAKVLAVLVIAALIAILGFGDRLPDLWDDGTDPVTLASIESLVEHGDSRGEQHEVPVGSKEPVSGGDTVRLGGEGEATIDYSKFVRVRLFRDTHLRALGEFNPAEPNAEMRVEQGTLVASILTPEAAEQLVTIDIESDVATIRARGTVFFVHVETTTGATWVIVAEGAVTLDGQGRSVTLVAGTQSWVEPGEPPVEPLPATREAVGDRFPPIGELTGGALSDADFLTESPSADESAPVIDSFELSRVTVSGETPERIVRVYVVASDPGSGVAEIVILVDGSIAKTCPDESCDVTVDPLPPGEYDVDVVVRDRAGNVAEDRRTLVVDVPALPDLVVESFDVVGAATPVATPDGTTWQVPVRLVIANVGTGVAGPFRYTVNDDFLRSFAIDGRVDFRPGIDGLGPGQSVVVERAAVVYSSYPDGPSQLVVYVDSCAGREFAAAECNVVETDESNNTSAPRLVDFPPQAQIG